MLHQAYEEDSEFLRLRTHILAAVPPERSRVLRVFLHVSHVRGDQRDVMALASDYVSFLGLSPDEIHRFMRIDHQQAKSACANIAEYELVMQDRQMPRQTAEALADAWLRRFGEDVVFLVNSLRVLDVPPSTEGSSGLFNTDLDAGVIAVSASRVGLFWNAENS